MATTKHPVLWWVDAGGGVTAALVGDLDGASAHADCAEAALTQLKELLEWRVEHEPWNTEPELSEPKLIEVRVQVRPQYRSGRRVVPCPETVALNVPCVTGRQPNGLAVCVVPSWQVQFNYQEDADLRGLVAHYVKEALLGLSPEALALSLPPSGCRLEEVSVRSEARKARRVAPEDRPELKLLFEVADLVSRDQGRRRVVPAAYGREAESEALAQRLAISGPSLLLVGEAGTGKSTLLRDAILRVVRGRVPGVVSEESGDAEAGMEGRRAHRFWRGSGSRMIAGMRYLGEWEERCETVIAQLQALEGVFCAENLLELVQVGGGGGGAGDSVAAFLLPYLQRGELRLVTEATPAEVQACRRLLPGLLDVFELVEVAPLGDSASEQVLQRLLNARAETARRPSDPAVATLVWRLFRRFQPYAAMPGPAAAFLLRLGARPPASAAPDAPLLSRETALSEFSILSGLPPVFLRDDLPLDVAEVRRFLGERVIGQPEAVAAGVRVVAAIKAGLGDPARPAGVLLFCGPTGVGKTELARALAEFCFGVGGAKDRLVRLDMSEYAGAWAARRLLQDPQGGPAAWVARVRRQPFCVVLFDEIEKADPEVFDVLLGLMDEGRLTDRLGRVTWFRSAIVLMTSNLSAHASLLTGFGPEDDGGRAADDVGEVSRFFRPEFVNRLDGVIRFQALRPADVLAIARKEMAELATREGLVAAGLRVTWSEALIELLAREGYDPKLGARPLQRVLEVRVAVPLARWRARHPKVRDITLRLDVAAGGRVEVGVL